MFIITLHSLFPIFILIFLSSDLSPNVSVHQRIHYSHYLENFVIAVLEVVANVVMVKLTTMEVKVTATEVKVAVIQRVLLLSLR